MLAGSSTAIGVYTLKPSSYNESCNMVQNKIDFFPLLENLKNHFRRFKPVYFWIVLGLFYLGLAIYFTWPLIPNFSRAIIGQFDFTDGPMFLWNFWVTKNAVLHLQNPFLTDLVYYPNQVNLSLVTYTFTSGLISIFLQPFFNLIETLNIITIGSIVASALGMSVLVGYLTKNRLAGIVPGVIFGFSPYVFSHLMAGHYNLALLWLFPLIALFFIKSLREESFINPILFSLFLILQSYLDLQLLFYSAIILLFIFLQHLITYNKKLFTRQKLYYLLIFLGLYGVIFVLPFFNLVSTFNVKNAMEPTYNNGDLAIMFGQNPLNPLLNSPNYKMVLEMIGGYRENVITLGYSVLAFAFLSLILFKKQFTEKLFYALLAVAGMILAFGPHPQIRHEVFYSIDFPFFYLQGLPGFNFGVVPTRFIVIAYFGLAVLAGFFISEIANYFNGKKVGYLIYCLILPAVVLVTVEYYSGEMKLDFLPHSSILETIKNDPGDFAVLSLNPTTRDEYYQTFHGKKLISGYLGRRVHETYNARYANLPGVSHLLAINLDGLGGDDLNRDLARENWAKLNIKYFTIDKTTHNEEFVRKGEDYFTAVGVNKVAEDASIVLYRITE